MEKSVGQSVGRVVGALLGAALAAPAAAEESFFNFQGSLAPGGYARYVAPVSNPLFNETPYITTELRPLYLHNEIPKSFVTGGGRIDLGAVEARVALTDRLGITAAKDGYGDIDYNGVFPHERGFANISIGVKYAVLSDPASESIVTLGAVYEPPSGGLRAGPIDIQGNGGAGFANLFVAGAKAFGKLGIEGNLGTNVAIDSKHDSSIFHYAAHVDYEILPKFYPLFEMNGFTVIGNGSRTPGNFEGVDLVNFGSTNAGTVVTAAFGARYRFNEHIQLGAAYEHPVTSREDLLGWRVYADLVLSY